MNNCWLLTATAYFAASSDEPALSTSFPAWPALRIRKPSAAPAPTSPPQVETSASAFTNCTNRAFTSRWSWIVTSVSSTCRCCGRSESDSVVFAHIRLLLDQRTHLGGQLGDAQAAGQILPLGKQLGDDAANLAAGLGEQGRAIFRIGLLGFHQNRHHLAHVGFHQPVDVFAHRGDVAINFQFLQTVLLKLLQLHVEHVADQFTGQIAGPLLQFLAARSASGLSGSCGTSTLASCVFAAGRCARATLANAPNSMPHTASIATQFPSFRFSQ